MQTEEAVTAESLQDGVCSAASTVVCIFQLHVDLLLVTGPE